MGDGLISKLPWDSHLPKGWHHDGCDRDDQCPKVTKLGKWLYLELRPYPILKNDFFPSLNETVPLFSDDSLCAEGLYVDSLVCSNLSIGEGRHYWLVEVNGGRMQQTYDFLQGVQPLTQEVYRMLQVTGVLLRAAGCSKPILRNPKLDQIAGKVETVQRRQQTVRVASRSRTYKLRKQLVKSMSSLTVAPAKLSFFFLSLLKAKREPQEIMAVGLLSDVALLSVLPKVANPIRLEKSKVAPKVRPAAGIPAKHCPLAAQLQRVMIYALTALPLMSLANVRALCGKGVLPLLTWLVMMSLFIKTPPIATLGPIKILER